jgi:hypothetical protein
MPDAEDDDALGPNFSASLRAELDRVQPPFSAPRYAGNRSRPVAWRLAPIALAIGLTGIAALTGWAATGSPNPAVWTTRVETVINPPSAAPVPVSSPSSSPTSAPEHHASAEPTDKAEPSNEPQEAPEPTNAPVQLESPEPSDHSGDGGSGSSGESASSSPSPHD